MMSQKYLRILTLAICCFVTGNMTPNTAKVAEYTSKFV